MEGMDRRSDERRIAYSDLRESERRFRDFAQTASDWFWESGPDHRFTMVFRSPECVAVIGFDPSRRIGHTRWDFAEDLGEEPEKWRLHRATLDARLPFRDFIYRTSRTDGTTVFISSNAKPMFDKAGEFTGYRGVSSDVTDSVRAATALRESEEVFRDFAELASDWFWETGPDHRFRIVSDRLATYGIEPGTRIGAARWEYATDVGEKIEKWRQHRAMLDAHKPFRGFVYRTSRADGSEIYISTTGKPLFDQGGRFLGYRGVSSDVTDAVRAAEALREAKEAEMRHLTQSMAAEAERRRLLERLVNVQEQERLRIARELHDQLGQDLAGLSLALKNFESTIHTKRGRNTLRQLEALTAEIGQNVHRVAWELRPTSLEDIGLVQAVEALTVDWSERTGIRVDYQSVCGETARFSTPAEITAYRVVQEALTNVVKHAAASTVSVVLKCDAEAVQIIVEDNGAGFDPATTPIPGRFGLAGMRERLSLVGGTITIDSAPKAGTAIYIRIPVERSDAGILPSN
jgi:PAS domain S-box-containing protein